MAELPATVAMLRSVFVQLFPQTFTSPFRPKKVARIVEKDKKDYGGPPKTQVKDLYAARMLVDSVEEGQTRLRSLRDHLKRVHPDLDFTSELKNPIVDGHKLQLWYITIKRHIELQILTYADHKLMTDTHYKYEETRSAV
jgi:hypothetical protein